MDFVRGVAILMVMSFHAITVPTNPFFHALEMPGKRIGWCGVDVFFVLSGFLVGGLLLKEYKSKGSVNAKRFLIRRAFKIWPAYYFYILVQVLIRRHPLNTFLVANLLHIQNYMGSSLEHTWTLAIEEHFYLILAIALAWMAGRKWLPGSIVKAFLIVIPLVIVLRCAIVFLHGPDPTQTTHTRIDSLLFGVALAALFHLYPRTFEAISQRTMLLIALLAACLIFLFSSPTVRAMETVGFTILYIGAAAFLLLVYRHSGRAKTWLSYRWVARIGVYSYGIYLWHLAAREPSWWLAHHVPPALQWSVLLIAQFVIAIVLGAVLTRVIEWPLLRLREKLFQPETALATPAAGDIALTL